MAASRTVLFGTDAPLSAAFFAGLVESGVDVVAVGVDGEHPVRPLFSASTHGHRETLASLATTRGLPVRAIPDVGAPGVRGWVERLAPDFILVACFSQLLPATLCACAGRDGLNLHPSLLPRYRGPTPLFWQLRAGEVETGVTLHRLSPDIDAGPIVGQAHIDLRGGLDGAKLEERCAAAGVELIRKLLHDSHAGPLPGVVQVEAQASFQPAPMAEDFRIDPDWSARHVYDFMRGTAHWGQPYRVRVDGREFLLHEAIECDPVGTLAVPFEADADMLRLRCRPGVLKAALA